MPIPMSYDDIAQDLTNRIDSGEYPPGSQLPTLATMARLYSVSVSTIQRALTILKARGVVVSSPGRAIYVAEKD
ncbi:winged helix-turn-helix domain-containing protein [Streptomyces xylophagus]|uniref:winged helix-turn-helix domain-containing protein n=1 Tax=Streptomyces xylophagus TaxID=285514 RepID=UPI0004C2E9F2|nr:winged helix-turn-helix domain-containing protein [Streptomyces xylophagus]